MQSVNASGVPVVIMTQSVNLTPDKRLPYRRMKPYLAKSLIQLGAVQIVFGIFTIVFNVVAIGLLASTSYDMRVGWNGIIAGIVFVITGPFGIVGGKKKGRCHIITFNVLSIISTVLAGSVIHAAITYAVQCSAVYNIYRDEKSHLGVALGSTVSVIGLLELIVAIRSAVVCCTIGACCCDCDGVCCCPSASDAAAQIAAKAKSADEDFQPLLNSEECDDQQLCVAKGLDSISTPGMADIKLLIDSNSQIRIGSNQI